MAMTLMRRLMHWRVAKVIDIDRERARFEEWARQNDYLMDRRTDTKSVMYESLATRCAWDGWKARASSAQKDTADDALNAARYKWLRENASVVFTETQCWKLENGQPIYSTMPGHLELDAAIDAAIATVERQVFCSFPDCGCDCSRLCMAKEGPNACALDWNVDKGLLGVKP